MKKILLSTMLVVFGVGFVGSSYGAAAAPAQYLIDQELAQELVRSGAQKFMCERCSQEISKNALMDQGSDPRCDICQGQSYYKPVYPVTLTPEGREVQTLLYPNARERPRRFKCNDKMCGDIMSRQGLVLLNSPRCKMCRKGHYQPYETLEDWEYVEEDEKEGR